MNNPLYFYRAVVSLAMVFSLNRTANAQYECGFGSGLPHGQTYEGIQRVAQNILRFNNGKPSGQPRGVKIIPVYVHIIKHPDDPYISDEQVYGQLEQLNLDYKGLNPDRDQIPDEFKPLSASTEITFCLAQMGIIRKTTNLTQVGLREELYNDSLGGSTAITPSSSLNIWVANLGDYFAGFATYPQQVESYKDGVVISSNVFGKRQFEDKPFSRVLTHEVGHYLGLLHTWGEDGSCDTDDGVLDTPMQSGSYRGCPEYPQYSCGSSDMFMNFMDYVDDDCKLIFTFGQIDMLEQTIALLRPGLVSFSDDCFINGASGLSMEIYPNPASQSVSVTHNGEPGRIILYSMEGQPVFQRYSQGMITLDLRNIPKGAYVLKLILADLVLSGKLLIQ